MEIVENQQHVSLEVVQHLAERLAELGRTEPIGRREQREELGGDARDDAVEGNGDVGRETGEIGIALVD